MSRRPDRDSGTDLAYLTNHYGFSYDCTLLPSPLPSILPIPIHPRPSPSLSLSINQIPLTPDLTTTDQSCYPSPPSSHSPHGLDHETARCERVRAGGTDPGDVVGSDNRIAGCVLDPGGQNRGCPGPPRLPARPRIHAASRSSPRHPQGSRCSSSSSSSSRKPHSR